MDDQEGRLVEARLREISLEIVQLKVCIPVNDLLIDLLERERAELKKRYIHSV